VGYSGRCLASLRIVGPSSSNRDAQPRAPAPLVQSPRHWWPVMVATAGRTTVAVCGVNRGWELTRCVGMCVCRVRHLA
jgi:hypothetical protein